MNGFNVSEAGHPILLIAPVDGNAGAPVSTQRIAMKNWTHASIMVIFGVLGGTPTSILLKAYAAATGGVGTALAFSSYGPPAGQGISNDVLPTRVDNTAAGITSALTSTDNTFIMIEIDSAALPDGLPFLELNVTMPASSNLVCAVAILSSGRYSGSSAPTVTA